MPASDGTTALEQCSIDRWYPKFRHVTIKTTVLPLSDDVVRYLLADGCFVPADADDAEDDVPSGSDAAGDAWSDDEVDDETQAAAAQRFPELELAIAAAIRKHGGAVFPKLNWSAPNDAAWVLGGSLKCTSARDVLLLLKSSDRISHDLCDARSAVATSSLLPSAPPPASETRLGTMQFQWVLALRRWSNLQPSSEFRCFACGHGHILLAACQRDRFSHYPFLLPDRARLLSLLQAFGQEHLADAELPARFVWDAYVDTSGRVYLIDIAPFHESTDPLLLDWTTLRRDAIAAEGTSHDQGALHPSSAATHAPHLYLVEEAHGVAPSAQLYYGVPHDLREHGGDLSGLLDAARAAAGSGDLGSTS